MEGTTPLLNGEAERYFFTQSIEHPSNLSCFMTKKNPFGLSDDTKNQIFKSSDGGLRLCNSTIGECA